MFTVLIPTPGAPTFLDNQIRLLRRYSAEPLNIVVVNDARPYAHPSNWMDAAAAGAITDVCIEHRASVLRAPERACPAPSKRAAQALNFGFSHVRRDAMIAIMDSDMFPVAPFSFREMLGNAEIAGIQQTRTAFCGTLTSSYLWSGFLLLKARELPDIETIDFNCTRFPRTDTGGRLSSYLRKHPTLNIRHLCHLASGAWNHLNWPAEFPAWVREFADSDPCNTEAGFFSEVYADRFFHFRSGSNWQAIRGDKSEKYAERFRIFAASLAART